MENRRMKVVNKVSFVTIFVNIALSVVKVIAGIFGRSGAMVADGIHSASDVVTTVIAYVGVKMATKEADEDHPYGHEKIEPVMGKILATILIITALFLGY